MGSRSHHLVSQEHWFVRRGFLGTVLVAVLVELNQFLGISDLFANDPASHRSASLLREEADDLVLAVFEILKHWRDDSSVQLIGVNGVEVFNRR